MAVSTPMMAGLLPSLIIGMTISLVAKPLPAKFPQDMTRDGCAIEADKNGHWPLHVWMDVLGVAPDKGSEEACARTHSWCDLYSMQDSLDKAQKDCSKFLRGVRKELKKVGR